jgi:hypothetical protein
MEMHMVHTNCKDASCTATKFLVLGFVFMLGDENAFLKGINYTKVSATVGSTYKIDGDINLLNLIDESDNQNYGAYTYAGSFTTPPCTEGVSWFVWRQPQTLSQDQWDSYAKTVQNGIVYSTKPSDASNPGTFRTAQTLGTRVVSLKYYTIKNGENKFSQAEIFGITIGTLAVLALFALLISFIIFKFITPQPEDAIGKIGSS